MVLPREWKLKPIIAVQPYSYNNSRICHNCYTAWRKQIINPCTGLCKKCVIQNPVQKKEFRDNCPNETQCRNCLTILKRTNFGIYRDVCEACKADQPQLRQRCVYCSKYEDNCWNNICIKCMSGALILCDRIGVFYSSWTHHNRDCWCLNYK